MQRIASAAAAATLCAGLATAADPLAAQDAAVPRERCYGVARAGENDGIGAREAAGSSRRDYQGDAWSWVPAGSCARIPLPVQPDGTPRRGALEPLARDTGN